MASTYANPHAGDVAVRQEQSRKDGPAIYNLNRLCPRVVHAHARRPSVLRKEGDGVLSRRDWNIAADLEIDLTTATASEAVLAWLAKPKEGQ